MNGQATIDRTKALTLSLKHGMSDSDIARLLNCSKQGVNGFLKPLRDLIKSPLSADEWNTHQESILSAAMQKVLLAATDSATVKKSSTLQLASAYGIFFDKQRLIRGESTSNVSVRSVSERIMSDIQRLEHELQAQAVVSSASDPVE